MSGLKEPASPRGVVAMARMALDRREFRFLLVGGANLIIQMTAFAVLHFTMGGVVGYLGTLVISYVIAILCAYVLHRRFVFQVRGKVLVDFLRFTSVQLVSLALNAATLAFFVEIVRAPILLGQFFSVVVVVIFNYFGHTFFSFRRKHGDATD